MTINVYHHFPDKGRDEFERKVLEEFNLIKQKLNKMADEMATLEAEVAETKTVAQSAVVLLQGLKQRLDEAGTDKVKLAALSADLGGSTDALAAAVVANTPADPTV